MTNRPEPGGFQSVDWDNLTEKRDWSGLGWTTAAVLVILLGFFGGMIFRTSLTGGPDDARELARTLLATGRRWDRRVAVIFSDMDQPLGCTVGNALEVRESIEVLQRSAEHSADLEELTLELTAEMIVLGGLADDHDAAKAAATRALEDGAALERLRLIIERQGGDAGVVDDPSRLPQAASSRPVVAPAQGFIERLDARLIGDEADPQPIEPQLIST